MDGRLIGRIIQPLAPAGGDIDAGDETHVAVVGEVELVVDGLAVGAPPFVAGDFHFHLPAVHQLVLRAVGADGPDAVDEPPVAFVAIEEERWVGRGELEVVEPVGAMLEQRGQLAGAQIDREHCHRQLGREAAGNHLALVGRFAHVGGGHARGRLACRAVVGAVGMGIALDEGAGAQSLVGVNGHDAGPAGKVDEVAVFPGVEIDAPHRGKLAVGGGLGVVERGRVGGDDDGFGRTFYDDVGLVGGEVEHGDALGCGVRHPFSVGGIGVEVEIETVGPRLARETNDAVPGVRIDP